MRGATLVELTTVTLIIGVMASMVAPPVRRYLDGAAVGAAAERFAAVHAAARQTAILKGRLARYEVDRSATTLTLSLRSPLGVWDTLRAVALGDVRLTVSQPTVTFSPLGIGFGASNTTVIISRGAAAETLTVSRTGRLRR
jgi:Tfp pilus assembly protein FimT